MSNTEIYSLLSDFDKELNNAIQILLNDLQLTAKKVSPWSFQGIKDFFKRVFNVKKEHFDIRNLITLNEIVDKSYYSIINEIAVPQQNVALDKFKNTLKALANKYIYKAHELGKLNTNSVSEPEPTAVPLEMPPQAPVEPQPTNIVQQPPKVVKTKTNKNKDKAKPTVKKASPKKKRSVAPKNRIEPTIMDPITNDNFGDLIS